MSYVLIPGGGGEAWYWHLVEQELAARGLEVVNVELPADDETAGLADYASTVIGEIGDRAEFTLVAHSMGGFTVPLVHQLRPARAIVLVNAMIPAPGETFNDWWGNTGQSKAQRDNDIQAGRDPEADFDTRTYFFHDVPDALTEYGMANEKQQSGKPLDEPCDFVAWPPVPTNVISARDDRIFPLEFQRRVARQRLGIEPDVVPGGHLAALSYPAELTDQIVSYHDR
jgi:pimeloyl-ACP methyl ester carboxylesterase